MSFLMKANSALDTWENTSYLEGAGVNVWSTFSCDEDLGMVYLPLTTPTNDHFGGDRLGDNLFAESVSGT